MIKDSKSRIKLNVLVLVVAVALSAYSMSFFEFFPDSSSPRIGSKNIFLKLLDGALLIAPGLTFSFFILTIEEHSRRQFWIRFLGFNILWLAAFFAALTSYGVLVPIVGWIAASIIGEYTLEKFEETKNLLGVWSLGRLGFVMGAFGFLCFYFLTNSEYEIFTEGIGFAIIVVLWQIGVGGLLIYKNHLLLPRKEDLL